MEWKEDFLGRKICVLGMLGELDEVDYEGFCEGWIELFYSNYDLFMNRGLISKRNEARMSPDLFLLLILIFIEIISIFWST